MAEKKVSILISAKNATAAAFASVRKGLSDLSQKAKDIFTSPAGMIGGALGIGGLGLLGKSFMDTAVQSENLRTRLEVLMGSAAKGSALFDDMAKYAARVPFELDEIMGAATQLAGVLGGDSKAINEWIPRIGNLAAATGLGIQETTEQVSRMLSAGAQSADLFQQRGINAMLGFQAGVSYSVDQTREKLATMLDSGKFAGATDKMAGTWTGLMSMLADKWTAFKQGVMDSGLFEALKNGLTAVLAQLDKVDMKQMAADVGQAILSVAKIMVTSIPAAILLILEGVQKVAMAFRGWQMLWAELRVQWADFMAGLWGGLNTFRDGMTAMLQALNVGGIFDKQLADSKRIGEEQRMILAQIAADKEKALQDQQSAIQKNQQEQQALDQLGQKVASTQQAFDEFAKAMTFGEKIKQQTEVANVAIDSTLRKLDELQAKQAAISLAPSGQFKGQTSFNESDLDRLSRTEG